MTTTKKWTCIRRIKRGHSYWRDEATDVVAISDDSGTNPENCDHPLLVLDTARAVVIGRNGCSVPVKTMTSVEYSTPAEGFEALWVATTFGLDLVAHNNIEGIRVKVTPCVQGSSAGEETTRSST